MKYYKLFAILILAGMMACSGEKKEKGSEESVETVLPDETNEVTVMKLNTTDFNHELISNGKLSARNFVDLKFESAEPIAKIYVKNGDRVTKGQNSQNSQPSALPTRQRKPKMHSNAPNWNCKTY